MPFLAAYPDRVLALDDDYGSLTSEFEGDVQCVDAGPHGVFVGADDGVSHRRAAGDWEHVAAVGDVTSVAVAESGVWAGTEPSAVYHAPDGGEFEQCAPLEELPSSDEWAFPPRPHTSHVRWLAADPAREGRVLVAVEAGALVVLDVADGTASFRERPPGARRDTHSMATHPDAPGRVYAAAGDGYAESHRHGDDWAHPQAGLEHRYCWSVAVDASDPDVRLVSAASGARTAHSPGRAETYVYRKRGEDPWTLATDGLGDPRAPPDLGVEGGDDGPPGGVTRRLDAPGGQRRRDVRRQRHLGAGRRVDVSLPVGVAELRRDVDAAVPQFGRDRRRRVGRPVGLDERAEEVEGDCHRPFYRRGRLESPGAGSREIGPSFGGTDSSKNTVRGWRRRSERDAR